MLYRLSCDRGQLGCLKGGYPLAWWCTKSYLNLEIQYQLGVIARVKKICMENYTYVSQYLSLLLLSTLSVESIVKTDKVWRAHLNNEDQKTDHLAFLCFHITLAQNQGRSHRLCGTALSPFGFCLSPYTKSSNDLNIIRIMFQWNS